ncbi:MAG: acyl-CoA dehydrogenase [Myxococcales bacterium]|nr:acyl-CoA dehydrogenase [Myxococcales bacterium]
MNFDYTPAMNADLKAFAKFCREQIAPHAMELDQMPAERAQALLRENLQKLAAGGFLGRQYPTAFGGQGQPSVETVALQEELAQACPATFLSASVSVDICGAALLAYGSGAQKDRYLTALAQAQKIGCFALTEPEGGTDLHAVQTRAEPTADGWVINGTKSFITNAPIADFAILLAKIVRDGKEDGTGLFVVDRDTPGFSRGEPLKKMGYRGSPTGELRFADCRVPADALLGEAGKGHDQAMKVLVGSRIGFAAGAIGLARTCFDEATKYAHRRKAFGHKIISFQEVGFKLADMKMLIDTATLLVRRAAWLLDNRDPEADPVGRCAKVFATEAATKISSWAVQVHGGNGYLSEFPVERLYRDARLGEIGEGTNEIQRVMIAKDCLSRWT